MDRLVGVDIDGVIADIASQLVKYAADLHGCILSPESITSENVEACSDLSSDQVKEIFSSSSFFQTLPVFPSAKASLAKLNNNNWRIVLMTDRFWYPEIQDDTLTWLRENDLTFDSLYFVSKKNKAACAKELGINVFIEDQLSNATLLSEVCEQIFLVDRSYNQGPIHPRIIRVSELADAVQLLNK